MSKIEPPKRHRSEAPASDVSTAKQQDEDDLLEARSQMHAKDKNLPWWKMVGPGLITGAADDDPSGIGTYSVAGAQFGYLLLWLIPVCLPLMIAVQEMCGRVGVVLGTGLAGAIKRVYPKWVLYGSLLLLICANVTNIYADLNVMAASAKMLFNGPLDLWLALMTLSILLLQVFIPYHLYVRWLKWLCLALLAYAITALLPGVHNNWGQIARHLFIPVWHNDPAYVLTVVGFLGTTISPYLFFWQAGEEIEEEVESGKINNPGHRITKVTNSEIRALRSDTIVGMVASQLVTFFVVICTASTLHASGKTDINTAQDAARALLPLGKSAYWLFTLGIIGTGSLAIPTLAGSLGYAFAETFGWRYGLYRRLARAKAFYAVIGVSILAGYALNFVKSISPVKALLYSAVVNGVLAPPLIVVLILICNNTQLFGKRTNGAWSNALGWISVLVMGGTATLMIWSMVTGKGS